VAEVQDVTIYEYAPDRVAIILGVAAGAAALMGALAFRAAGNVEPPQSDVAQSPGPYFVAAGFTLLTFGVATAIAVPVTSGLGEHSDAPRARVQGRW